MDEPVRVTVEGETFEISVSRDGQRCDYWWVAGRHHGEYGFHGGPDLWTVGVEGHRRLIHDFLSAVDPETGFLE